MLQSSSQAVPEWGRGEAGRQVGEGEEEGEGERRLRGREGRGPWGAEETEGGRA